MRAGGISLKIAQNNLLWHSVFVRWDETCFRTRHTCFFYQKQKPFNFLGCTQCGTASVSTSNTLHNAQIQRVTHCSLHKPKADNKHISPYEWIILVIPHWFPKIKLQLKRSMRRIVIFIRRSRHPSLSLSLYYYVVIIINWNINLPSWWRNSRSLSHLFSGHQNLFPKRKKKQ